MPIYEASFLGEPTPIKSKKKGKAPAVEPQPPAATIEPKPKTVRKRKTPKPASDSSDEVLDLEIGKAIKKVKKVKVPVESQAPIIEAPKKRQRKPKPQPSEQAKAEVAEELVAKGNKKASQTQASEETIEKVARKKPVKTVKKIIDGATADEPPSWFKAWVLDQKKRENAEKPKKEKIKQPELKAEATVEAEAKWNDGLTRDRVRNEVDNHMGRLFRMIHGRSF